MKKGKEIAEEYTKLSSKIQILKKKIEDIRKLRILDESKAKILLKNIQILIVKVIILTI